MSHEFRVVISSPDDPAGTGDPLSAAAARTPDATLEALAASAREAQASAEAARLPMAGLVNAPDAVLAKLETGFGRDAQAKIIGGVERIGQVFAESSPRPPESSGGSVPTTGASSVPPAEDRSAGSAGQPPAAPRAHPGDLPTGIIDRLPGPAERLVRDAAGFPAAPTARASLGLALTGLGTPTPTATLAPGAPAGGQAGSAAPGVGKAAAGRSFEEAARTVDHLHTALDQGFQTFNERLARVEQTAREHTSQISNRS